MSNLIQSIGNIFPPLILLGVALGVIGKYYYDYLVRYFKASDRNKVKWVWKDFWLTLGLSIIISFILYAFVLEKVRELNEGMLIFSIAAQTGFFSQAIIGEIGKKFAE